MASVFVKPTMLRQSCFSLPVKRAFTTGTSLPSNPLIRQSPLLKKSNAFVLARTLGALPQQTRIAAFHASAKRDLLPPGPQVIEGTTNDPAPVPKPEPLHGSYHWTFERLIAVALVPLTVAPFAAGTLNPTLDALFIGTLLIHSHVGFQSVIIDYIPWKKHPFARNLFWWGLRFATLTVAVGFYEFETHDVGVTEAVKRIWKA